MARTRSWIDVLWQLWNSPSARAKLVSLVLLVVAMVWGWRRLQSAQERDRNRRRQDAADDLLRAGGGAAAGGAAGGAADAAAARPVGGARPAGADDTKSAARRAAAPNAGTPAGRVTKYLERNGGGAGGPRMVVCVSARAVLSGLTVANSDGFAAPIEFTDAPNAAPDAAPGAIASAAHSAVELLRRMSSVCTVYVITKVPSNPSALEARVVAAFDTAGLLSGALIKPHNLLFCSSAAGKSAIIRHITPNLVVDDEYDVLEKLRPHLDDVVHVPPVDTLAANAPPAIAAAAYRSANGSGGSRGAGTIGQCLSLAQYFFGSAAPGSAPANSAAPAAAVNPGDQRDVKSHA